MSESESSVTTNCTENEKKAECRSAEDGGARERVLKEVGLTSATFIGPAFPPRANVEKPDIEDSLSEFYKELKEIESSDGAEAGRGGACRAQPPRKTSQHALDEIDVHSGCSDEADGHWKQMRRDHTRSHRYQHEPYQPWRPRLESQSGSRGSDQARRSHAPLGKGPENVRYQRAAFPRRPPSPAFPDAPPPAAPSFRHPDFSHSDDRPYFPSFPAAPPPHHSSPPPYWDVYGDFSGHVSRQRGGSGPPPHSAPAGWGRPPYDQDYPHAQRFDSLDDVWERRHHLPARDHAHPYSPAPVLILMRGLPGSGKSTRARELLSAGPSGVVLSADDFFAHSDGYHYEPGLLGAAHEWNQHRAGDALLDGRSPVVIDNTNLQLWEMKPYVRMALERGYRVEFCEPDTSWKFDARELERRNKHGVSQEKIQQMLDHFSSVVSVDAVLDSREPPHVKQRRRAERPPTSRNSR